MRMPWHSDDLPEPEERPDITPHTRGRASVTTGMDKAIAYFLSAIHPMTILRTLGAEFRGIYMVSARLRSWINVDDKPQLAQAGQKGALDHASESRFRRFCLFLVLGADLVLLGWTCLVPVGITGGLFDLTFTRWTIVWAVIHAGFFFWVGRDGPVLSRVQTARMTGEYLIRQVVNEITIPAAKMKDNPSVTTVLARPVQRLSTDLGYETTVRIHDQGDPVKLLSYAGTGTLAHKMHLGRSTVYTFKVPTDTSLVRLMMLDRDPWTLNPTRNPAAVAPRPFNIWRDKAHLGAHPGGFPWVEPLLRAGRGRNILVGGAPRAGKSVFLRNLCMYLALAGVDIALIDGKSVDFLALERYALHYIGETDIEDEVLLNKTIAVLEKIKTELRRRMTIITKNAREHGGATHLTEEMSEELGMRPLWLIIDELATFTEEMMVSHKKLVMVIMDLIRFIASKGPSFGIITVLATQRPNDKSVPSSLRGLFTWRVAFYIGNQAGSFAITEKSGDEYRADKLEFGDPESIDYKLVSIVPHLKNPVRHHLGTADDLTRVVSYAVALRADPKKAENPDGARWPSLIERIMGIFESRGMPERLVTAILISELGEISPHALGKALKPFGIESQRWSEGNQDQRGYYRADFERVAKVPGGRVNDPAGTDGPAEPGTGPADDPGTSPGEDETPDGWAANRRP